MELATQTSGSGNKDGNIIVGIDCPDSFEYIREIGDAIMNLSLKEAVQLREYLENVHGIEPSKKITEIPESKPEVKPEQTEWSVILDGYESDKKLSIIKSYREIMGSGLKESKEAVENNIGKAIKEGLSLNEANSIKDKLTLAGARVTVK